MALKCNNQCKSAAFKRQQAARLQVNLTTTTIFAVGVTLAYAINRNIYTFKPTRQKAARLQNPNL